MRTRIPAVLCTLLVFGACQSMRESDNDVPDSLLAYVPQSGQTHIEEARQRRGEVMEQKAIAMRDENEVESYLQLAQEDLEVLQLRYEEASKQVAHVKQFGSNEELEAAERRRDEVDNAVRLARAKVDYYEDLTKLGEVRVAWIEKRAELADARYQLAKAKAVSELDRPVAENVDLGDLRSEVAQLEDEVQRAAMEVEVARQRAELQSEFVAERQDGVPEGFRMNEIAKADDVFSAEFVDRGSDPLIREASAERERSRQAPESDGEGASEQPSNRGNDGGDKDGADNFLGGEPTTGGNDGRD